MSEQTTTSETPKRHWSGYNKTTKPHGNKPVIRSSGNPDRMMAKIKQLVVDNYNTHHDASKTPPLQRNQVNITYFARGAVGSNFTAIAESSVVHGVLYHVTYDSQKSEATVEVFRRFRFYRIPE